MQEMVDHLTTATRAASLPPTGRRRPLVRAQGPRWSAWADPAFRKLCGTFALSIVALVGLMLFVIARGARLSLARFGLRFVTSSVWDPVAEQFGALPFVYGTLVSSLIALCLAVPLGLGIAIFLVEISPRWLREIVGFLVELLAAIPSVVYGLWGLFVLAPVVRTAIAPFLRTTLGFLPLFSGEAHGVGMLTAGIVLAIMILPFIAAVSRDVLDAVPREQRQASLALGATQSETIWHVVLPYGRAGIVGAVILALGRAIGETMAVTMVIGNNPQIRASLFAPGYTMSSVIANEFAEASSPLYLSALIEIGLLLFVVTFVINGLARLLIWRMVRSTPSRRR